MRTISLGVDKKMMVPHTSLSGRQLAAFLNISPRSVGRLERDGLLFRCRGGTFELQTSVQSLLHHFMLRERWAFQKLRRLRIFDETQGDVFEPTQQRGNR